MALTKQDREWLELTIKTTIQTEFQSHVAPLATKVGEHEQTLYGIDRQNGLRSQVRQLNKFAWLITGGLMLGASTAFYELFIK